MTVAITSRARVACGFTLVELLVAMTLGLFLTVVVAQLFLGSRATYTTTDELSRMQENIRFTQQLLGRVLYLTSYMSSPNSYRERERTPNASTPVLFEGGTTALTANEGAGTASDAFTVRFEGSGPAGAADGTITDCLGRPIDSTTMAVNIFSIGANGGLMWGTIEWVLNATTNSITVTTSAISASTNNPQGFGYAISGTTKDGPHFHSGIYGFNFTDPYTGVLGCTNCDLPSASSGQRGPQSQTYTLGSTTAGTLQDPLWYAAKFGSFNDVNGNGIPDQQSEWDIRLADGSPGQDGVPDTYFLVTNPLGLESSLDRAFQAIILSASLTSVAANSGSLQTLTTVYQARFNTADWSGGVIAYAVNPDVTIDPTPVFDAGLVLNTMAATSRTIITYNDTASVRDGVAFRWPANPSSPTSTEISTTLVGYLKKNPDTNVVDTRGPDRLNYLRGDTSRETGSTAIFRQRASTRLGDIVNSNPIFVAGPDASIPDTSYGTFRNTYFNRPKMLYVGANDGMAHIDRRAALIECTLDDLDRTIDTGAETAGIRQNDLHCGMERSDASIIRGLGSRLRGGGVLLRPECVPYE